jgi:hypothetical protein
MRYSDFSLRDGHKRKMRRRAVAGEWHDSPVQLN